MVESTLIGWEDLGLSPLYANYVLFMWFYIYIYIYIIMLGNDIVIKLYSLAWNMNWHDGLVLTWHFRVVGSNLGEPKLNFIFGYFGFGFEFEGLKETLTYLAAKGN